MAKSSNISKGIKTTKGLTTKQILNMDVYKLNTKSLRNVTSRLISSANKRIRSLRQKAPHSRALYMHPNEFSLKGIKKTDRNAVESLMKEIKSFMNAESSTIKGYQSQREKITSTIGEFDDIEQENEFWETFNEWVDANPTLASMISSSQLQDIIYERYVGKGMTKQGTKASITRLIKKMTMDVNQKQSIQDKAVRDVLKNDDAFKINGSF
ncbi:MAG: hypothetical protein IKT40_14375 [Bacilli bacterium]|nr:hypothetical protein [Bacilli bacterium]